MQTVSYQHEDRQWDVRINVQDDEYLEKIVENIMLEHVNGKFRYVLVGGLEIGTRPNQTDYQVRHIHCAVVFHNRASKASIIKNWGIVEGNGYYLVPRNRELPYSGWRNHHVKEFSKVNPTAPDGLIIMEYGDLPKDSGKRKAPVLRSENEKKMKLDDCIKHMRQMIEDGAEDEAFNFYPRSYIMYGEKIKSLIAQKKKDFKGKHVNPNLYVYGYPGSGKTSLMQVVFPGYYKKDLSNRFWDLYDDKIHDYVMLEDLDGNALEKLGLQWFKTICDEAGFPIDQKYKTPQITRATILVTSNYSLCDMISMMEDIKCVEDCKAAVSRRFFTIRVDQLHRLLGVKLINEYERKQLKREGNEDPRRLYMDWNYNLDTPTGEDLKTPEQYQEIIREFYYK